MLLLRAALLEILVCIHVVGAAVLFRRLFPRESPWLAFLVPTLMVMSGFNFIEHFIALPQLGWLLPFTLGGLLWAVARPGYSWEGLRLPAILFVVVFTWDFFIRCLNPSITCNTEGVADMARMVDFCLGGKLPAVDSWCPPYDHGGYYSFQHYGASLLKRLFSLDIGTGYNMGYTMLNALTVLAGAGAAHAISGNRAWIAVATGLVLLANFSGASVILFFWDTAQAPRPDLYNVFDSRLAIDIGDGWNDPARHNPFGWIWAHRDPPAVLRLFTPTFNTYSSEFHANLGGHFITLASLLAANEAFKPERSNWPWICLLVFPLITIILATWFMIVVSVLCAGCLAVALLAAKRPENGKVVLGGSILAFVLLWPSVDSLISGSYPADFHWTPRAEYTAPWEFVIQWWPIIVPWIFLCFIWPRLSPLARWIHAAVPLLLIFVEAATFGDRGLTIEKMWGAIYGAGMVTFLPLVFMQKEIAFRLLTIIFLSISAILFGAYTVISTEYVDWQDNAFHLKGDSALQTDPQKKRLLQVLQQLHGVTVLNGKSAFAYNQSPSVVGFSENRCYIAWYYQEYQCGHGGEAEYRDKMSNAFFAGTMPNPLAFLRGNAIAAVMIWPDDMIPDSLLRQFQAQLGSDYFYVDCKGDGPANAGIFLRQSGASTAEATSPPARGESRTLPP
jgi:hypothetical protein